MWGRAELEPGAKRRLNFLDSADAPIEMRGTFLSVALESLTDYYEKSGKLESCKLLSRESWEPLRDLLLKSISIDSDSFSLTSDQKRILKERVLNINGPTNAEKLTKPFDISGISLTKEELDAIKQRNVFLHGRRILSQQILEEDRSAWQSPYKIEMLLYTAVNKLLLKTIGYSGPILDWGRREIDSHETEFVMI